MGFKRRKQTDYHSGHRVSTLVMSWWGKTLWEWGQWEVLFDLDPKVKTLILVL